MQNYIHKTTYFKYIILAFLFITAFLERTIWDLGPNIELVTTAMILASFYLGRKSSFWLTFAIIAFSDRFIGNTKIFFFTWSGFLIPSLLFPKLFKYLKLINKSLLWKLLTLTGSGLFANLFFYIHTNFGVWFLDSWGMYSKDVPGLIKCYIYGLPFLKNQGVSSLIFIPAGYIAVESGYALVKKIKLNLLPKTNKILLK